ncbi:MAG: DCC1-like thiol-disulfide oxidoreductase family protein, partial [Planctomycetota bacterium]|nr:DCC1-like thiol-disulfide oxidoreductase family protein [Planctomycetota bacterium]
MADPPDPPPQITHRAGAVEARPVLVFDGECGFCRRWVARWRSSTGDDVEYAAYQDVSGRFGQLSLEDVQRSVQLIEPDDRVSRGAEAIFRTLTHGPGRRRRARAVRWAYERLPGVAPVAEWAYRFVARRRVGFSRLSDLLVGREIGPASFLLSRAVFLRL